MAVVSFFNFRTLPGKSPEHLAATEEARQILVGLGQQAMTLQTVAGSEAGLIGTVINHSDNTEWAIATEAIRNDPTWLAFYARVSAAAIAEPVENSVFSDLDATYAPRPDRPLGALALTQWRPIGGRFAEFLGQVGTASTHIERLGGSVRVMQCLMGAHPMSVMVAVGFEDLRHMGEYNDKLAVDEQWNGFWADVMSDPSAELVRTQVAVTTR